MEIIDSIFRLMHSKRFYNINYKPKIGEATYDEIGNPKFTRYIKASLRKRYIAFDVETTGLNPYKGDRIFEVAAVLFIDGKPVKYFSSLVYPKRFIPWEASRVNGISNMLIWLAPSEDVVYRNLIEFIEESLNGNTIICAYNADFHFDFLYEAFGRFKYKADIKCIDTLYLARKYIRNTENYKLGTIMEYYGFKFNTHCALDDALGCGKVLWAILEDLDKKEQAQ